MALCDSNGMLRRGAAMLLDAIVTAGEDGIDRKTLQVVTKLRSVTSLIQDVLFHDLATQELRPRFGRRSVYCLVATDLAVEVLRKPELAQRIIDRIPEPVEVTEQELPPHLLAATYQ